MPGHLNATNQHAFGRGVESPWPIQLTCQIEITPRFKMEAMFALNNDKVIRRVFHSRCSARVIQDGVQSVLNECSRTFYSSYKSVGSYYHFKTVALDYVCMSVALWQRPQLMKLLPGQGWHSVSWLCLESASVIQIIRWFSVKHELLDWKESPRWEVGVSHATLATCLHAKSIDHRKGAS